MPGGVRTGFVRASRVNDSSSGEERPMGKRRAAKADVLVEIPALDQVLLKPAEEASFDKDYRDIGGSQPQLVEFPRLDAFPTLQRCERPHETVRHSKKTTGLVKTLKRMQACTRENLGHFERNLDPADRDSIDGQQEKRRSLVGGSRTRRTSHSKAMGSTQSSDMGRSEPDSGEEGDTVPSAIGGESGHTSSHSGDADPFEAIFCDGQRQRQSSSRSSLPSMALNEPSAEANGESEEDLPDCETLLGTRVEAVEKTSISRQRKQRIIIDDSDDE